MVIVCFGVLLLPAPDSLPNEIVEQSLEIVEYSSDGGPNLIARASPIRKPLQPAMRREQSVIASVVNGEGERVHSRTWDSHFIGLPVVNPRKQNRNRRSLQVNFGRILADR